MNTVTHALLPVILVSLADRRKRVFQRGALIAVAVSGALPDLLNPHLSLKARMYSWSHGLTAWLGFSLLVGIVITVKKWPKLWWLAASAAYALHLFCDAISGGINWAYPVADRLWGDYWFPPQWWVPLDVVLVLFCYFYFRAIPAMQKARAGKRSEI